MVAYQGIADILADDEIDRIFHALADATRRDIVARTLRTDGSISELAEGYLMSFAAVQKHVAVLEKAGLVRKQKRGREQLVRAVPQTIHLANELLTRYESLWRARAAAIEDILTESPHHDMQADTRSGPRTAPASPPTEGSAT